MFVEFMGRGACLSLQQPTPLSQPTTAASLGSDYPWHKLSVFRLPHVSMPMAARFAPFLHPSLERLLP